MHLRQIASVSTLACWGAFSSAALVGPSPPAVAADTTAAQLGRKSDNDASRALHRNRNAVRRQYRRRTLGSDGGKGKGHYSSRASRSSKSKSGSRSKGSKGKGGSKSKGRGMDSSSSTEEKPADEPRTIYETVQFVLTSTGTDICGTRDELAPFIEAAFLAFYNDEQEECNPRRAEEVVTLVLREYTQPAACPPILGRNLISLVDDRSIRDRRLQNDQEGIGVFDRQVSCRRACTAPATTTTTTPAPRHRRDLGSKRSSSSMEGKGGSSSSKAGSKGGSSSSKGSKSKGSKGRSKGSTSGPSSSSSSCPVVLVDYIRDVGGFDDVTGAVITGTTEAACSLPDSDDCTESGACCGVCGCACWEPSESLCRANDYCIGGMRPFDERFCWEFIPEGEGEEMEESYWCEKESCDGEESPDDDYAFGPY